MAGNLRDQLVGAWKLVSLFPDWTGRTQPRVVEIDRDTLRLGTEAPVRSSGKVVMSYLERERAGRE